MVEHFGANSNKIFDKICHVSLTYTQFTQGNKQLLT